MIWFPIEVTITVFILDRIIRLREDAKEKERYNRIVRRHSSALVMGLKRQIIYFFEGPSIKANIEYIDTRFKEILSNPEKLLTQDFFDSMREQHFLGQSEPIYYNYSGIAFLYTNESYEDVKQYINKYSAFIDDDVFQILDKLQDVYRFVGKLDFKNDKLWTTKRNIVVSKWVTEPIIEMVKLVAELEKEFNKEHYI